MDSSLSTHDHNGSDRGQAALNGAAREPGAALPPLPVLDEAVLELMPAAVYICDADGRILRYNRRASELWGRTPQLGESQERFCGAYRLFYPDGRDMPHDECPMAEALRTGAPIREREIRVERPDGSRIWAQVSIQPIFDERGGLAGAINCLHDISAAKAAEQKLREHEELLRGVIETTPECVKIVGPDGTLLLMNHAGLKMVEAESSESVYGACTFDLISPEDRELWRSYHDRVCAGEHLAWEFDIIGLGGTRRHMETHAVPLRLPNGGVAQLAVTRDISERKRHEVQQRLLINELNHRVKNSLATVQSVVMQTLRNAGTMEGVRGTIDARLVALARAHDILTSSNWEDADFGELVRAALNTHCTETCRCTAKGGELRLPPKTALSLAMALHELCTNAVKYGALATETGRIDVRWQVEGEAPAQLFRFRWTERGGPPVAPPSRQGFGTRLIKVGLAAELGGEVQLDYRPEGLVCTIEAPVNAA